MRRATTSNCARRQRGAAMLFALILLVALTLAGIALTRSVSTTNIIAGNMAFQQAATHAADVGIERAIVWLEANNSGTTLHASALSGPAMRYAALRLDPATNVSWDKFWTDTLAGNGSVNTLPTDAAGNTVSFVIQRLCSAEGVPNASGCATSPIDIDGEGNSKRPDGHAFSAPKQVYYRITARVSGPRNTLSYVQAVVSL